MMIGPP